MGRPVHLAQAAPVAIDDLQVKAWIGAMLDGTHPEFDPPDDQTMYVLYYPAGTTYTLGDWTGCNQFGASDNLTQLPSGRLVPYIVIPRCPPLPGLDEWNSLTAVTSHELYEEATDPEKTAFVTVDDAHMAWSLTPPFSEIGDMCIADPAQYVVPTDLGAAVQRAWSNAAARAGKNPCVPAPAGPYFNAAPVLVEDLPISFRGYREITKGVRVPVGTARTVEVDLFSEAPVPAWHVSAYDQATLGGLPSELTLTLNHDSGRDGDQLTLTISRLANGDGEGSRFVVYSDDGQRGAFFFGFAGN
jgi:hypothetical protein